MLTIQSFTFNPASENTYVLFNETGSAVIIDPGCYSENEQHALQLFIELNDLKVIQLINTHCHLDHVFGLKWVHENYDLEPFIHLEDKKILESAPQSALRWGLTMDNYTGKVQLLEEGDEIHIGTDKLSVLHTPGHSPGSISFYCKEQGFVISGDVLFKESIGRTDLPEGNHHQLIRSIQTKLFTLPDETIVYNGHGNTTTIGHEKEHNPYL